MVLDKKLNSICLSEVNTRFVYNNMGNNIGTKSSLVLSDYTALFTANHRITNIRLLIYGIAVSPGESNRQLGLFFSILFPQNGCSTIAPTTTLWPCRLQRGKKNIAARE